MKLLTTVLFCLAYLTLFSQESWIIDQTGCKVLNPNPKKKEAIEWTGDCLDGIASGEGKLTWYKKGKKTGNIYTGMMKNGRPEGQGKYILGSDLIIEGVFKNGEISHGKKILQWKNDTIIYVGEFEKGIVTGKGIMYFSDKDTFEGQFENGYCKNGTYTSKKHGYVIESADWKYFTPKSGKITLADGRIFEGKLKNFSPHGYGKVTYPNGKIEYGVWK